MQQTISSKTLSECPERKPRPSGTIAPDTLLLPEGVATIDLCRGNTAKAKQLSRNDALRKGGKVVGVFHLDTLGAMKNLSTLCDDMKRL
jgi:hypothetical protein